MLFIYMKDMITRFMRDKNKIKKKDRLGAQKDKKRNHKTSSSIPDSANPLSLFQILSTLSFIPFCSELPNPWRVPFAFSALPFYSKRPPFYLPRNPLLKDKEALHLLFSSLYLRVFFLTHLFPEISPISVLFYRQRLPTCMIFSEHMAQ